MALLPCPFCGSTRAENHDGPAIYCVDCGAKGPDLESLERCLRIEVRDRFDAWDMRNGKERVIPVDLESLEKLESDCEVLGVFYVALHAAFPALAAELRALRGAAATCERPDQ